MAFSIVVEPVNHLQVGFTHTAAEATDLTPNRLARRRADARHDPHEHRGARDARRHPRARWALRHFHLADTNGGLYGTGNLDFAGVLGALDQAGYDGYASVKIYRTPSWDVAARSAIAYVREVLAAPTG